MSMCGWGEKGGLEEIYKLTTNDISFLIQMPFIIIKALPQLSWGGKCHYLKE